MIHPNAAAIRPPAIAFGAGCVAELPHKTHSAASRIHGAGVLFHIVRVADNPVRLAVVAVLAIADSIPVIPVPTGGEISPASVVYPNALIVRPPAIAFGTRRVAVLR